MGSLAGRWAKEAAGTGVPWPVPTPGQMPTLAGHVSGGRKVGMTLRGHRKHSGEGSLVLVLSSRESLAACPGLPLPLGVLVCGSVHPAAGFGCLGTPAFKSHSFQVGDELSEDVAVAGGSLVTVVGDVASGLRTFRDRIPGRGDVAKGAQGPPRLK